MSARFREALEAERRRLAHSLLLHGENLGTLATVAHAIADRLLNDPRRSRSLIADCIADSPTFLIAARP